MHLLVFEMNVVCLSKSGNHIANMNLPTHSNHKKLIKRIACHIACINVCIANKQTALYLIIFKVPKMDQRYMRHI